MRVAIFPGSFDPVTKGHEDVVRRAIPLFDKIVVAVGRHSSKKGMFTIGDRVEMLSATFEDCPTVEVASFEGLTADFCRANDAHWLLRGVRNGGDFEYERTIAQMTKVLHPSLETVILFTDPEFAHIHSNVVREILKNGGDASAFVPDDLAFPDA